MTQYIVIGDDGNYGKTFYGPFDSYEAAKENMEVASGLGCGCVTHTMHPLIPSVQPPVGTK